MGWTGEFRRSLDGGGFTEWLRAGEGPYPTQEQAKAQCKAVLEAHRHRADRCEFRIVRDDGENTVDAVSNPPHKARMRWVSTWRSPFPLKERGAAQTALQSGRTGALDDPLAVETDEV